MPKDQLFYTNGQSLKSIDLPQYPNEAWDWITGEPETKDTELYARVAAVYRVANMSAEAISSMPFAVMKGDSDFDVSDNWQNKVGFLPRPKELFRLWRLSLFMTSKAYGFKEGNVPSNFYLRYILPTSISTIIDKDEGLVGFKRSVNNESRVYQLYENPKFNQIFYMHRMDHTTEVEPSKNSEFRALMNAAGAIFYADEHIKNFFMRGGIKPTMLMVKGVPTREEREKVENLWTRIIGGFYKSLGKVFNAESIEPKTIGEGVENLKDNALHREKISDIAMAAGMPLSLLLSNSANYATANVEYATWFNYSVVPWAEYIQEELNEQLFAPLGYRFEFRPEITNMGTEEERERAGAYAALVASNILPSVAAQMLGYDLPTGIEDFEQLDEDYFMMLERKALVSGMGSGTPSIETPAIDEPKPPRPNVTPPREAIGMPKAVIPELTLDQLRELDLWQQIAFRKHKRGESLSFPFVAKELDEGTAAKIRARLPRCKSEEDVKAAFDVTAQSQGDELLILADALNRAAEMALKVDEPILEQQAEA